MKVQKRDGRLVNFNEQKIVDAILSAFKEVDGELSNYAVEKATNIASYIKGYYEDEDDYIPNIEEIQDLVEKGLMSTKRKDVAKAYVLYREERTRNRGNLTDKSVADLLDGTSEYWNSENANKNAYVVTTQRDYLAGITSTDITRRLLLSKEIVEAHDAGIIHFHDADYFAQNALNNCFRGDTKFISSDGVRPFCSYKDGDEVFVPTHTGEWKKAKIKKYGIQKLNLVTFKRGPWSERQIYVTNNHRWLLKDGTETTNLKINDYLYSTPNISEFEWDDLSIDEKILWCKGFAYGDGTTIHFGTCDYTSIRLCGKKNQYIDYFIEAGFNVTYPSSQDGDASIKIPNFNKNILPDMHTPEEFKIFTNGYLCADGHHTSVKGASSKNEFRGVQITGAKKCKDVYDLLNKSGYYVSSTSDLTNQNTNYGARTDTTYLYRFQANQSYRNWRVVNIQKDVQECEVWCLEVEDNHSFILEGGIVTGNCCLINLNDMLQNGTVINGVMIEKPHKFLTACTIATQIILGVSSSQYGGCTISLTHLAPFVRDSYNYYVKKYQDYGLDKKDCRKLAEIDLKKEIEAGVQTFNYQVNSMTNTNGQAPFLSVCMYLGETDEYKEELAMIIEEFLRQRMLGFKNEQGVYITPAFPKLLYVLEEDNIHKNSKYWYLTLMAAECTAKRMVPDYISEKVMKENKINLKNGKGECYPCMGCRSFLTPDRIIGNPAKALDYDETKGKYYGRFNIGVVTINLADIGLSANGDLEKFNQLMEERLELCHKALQARYNRISKITSDAAPILWQHGAFARLDKGEKILPLLKGGYCTLSLGYAGLYECVKAMTGKSHTDPEVQEFALSVMQKLNDKCNEWKQEENIDYSVYGTPIESTTYKFAKALKQKFGKDVFIKLDGKDRDYITNSYHVPVFEKINPFEKLSLESKFQKLSPGGAISYIECADLTNNIPAVLEVIKFIYNTIMYAELNTKSDYCQVCGYDGEIKIIDENNTLDWECPNCGNRDHTKMNVARRTCGYIGTNFFNQGRTDEIRNRYVHLDDHILGE